MKAKDDLRRRKRSFRNILSGVVSENAHRLMGRAHLTNKLAKSLRGQARLRAYEVKTRALLELATRSPERTRIVNDFRSPRFVLVKTRRSRFGLHAPASVFGMV
jgi:hypothetical protein